MKMNRYTRSRGISRVCAILLTCASLHAGAQAGGQTEASQLISFSAQENVTAEDAVKRLSKQLEYNVANDELRSQYVERPGGGLQVQRFNQYYKGIRVEHGSMSITSKNGVAAHAFGRFYPTSAVATITPSLDEASALNKAKNAVPAEKYAWEIGSEEYPKGRLCLIEDFGQGDGNGILNLAYAFDIYAMQPTEARYMVYVDARDGHILSTDAILKHVAASGPSLYSGTVAFNAGKVGAIYYMHDSTRGNGIVTYDMNNQTNTSMANIETSASTVFAQDPAVDAHWGATVVYDYWKNVHSRNSWDGLGGILRSYVHYAMNYNNANWNGSSMRYGDGSGVLNGGFPPLTALDVCAHEIGHGICQSTAALVYQRESGAMNEGFSDIWGAVVEAYGDPHETDAVPKDPWLMGEELINILRSMKDPKAYGQPNTYLGQFWINASQACIPSGANDNCGVHYNSGVLNYWFYLLSVGGKGRNDLGNNYIVDSIGMDKAARIAYATELALNSTSNYSSCRTASIAQAATIYGACSKEVVAVTQAWYAVGVGPDPVPCTPQVAFGEASYPSNENAGSAACKPSHIVSVPISLNGPALTGDSAVVTVVILGGNAVQGVDYELMTPAFSFQPGGAVNKTIDLLVYDNGAPDADKFVNLTYTLNAGGTNAVRSVLKDTTRVLIYNDDYVPFAGSSNERTVLTFTAATNSASPFYGTAVGGHAMYMYSAAELQAAGVRPNVPITQAAFMVTSKVSTLPYYRFNLGLANTSMENFGNGIYTGTFTNVYSDSLETQFGQTLIPFKTPFVWNGVDNLVVETCFTNDSSYNGNDRVQGRTGSHVMTALNYSNFNPGCNVVLNTNYLVPARPVIQLHQTSKVETTKNSDRTWDVNTGKDAYFYSTADHELIAAVLSPSDSLGCVNVQVTQDGIGFRPASGGSQRSLKEFAIQPGVQHASIAYDAIFYVTNAELAGIDHSEIKIIQTISADDNNLIPSNTNVITPSSIVTGVDYVGFRGLFTGFGRFYLSRGVPALSVNHTAGATSEMWTGQNPFTDVPVLHWMLPASENVSIRMYDVTGKLVYGTEQKLAAGRHKLSLQSPANLVPGTYVLQVVRPGGVFTSRMTKQ